MSYNKTTWSAGDTITAEKLNKMEDGIASGGSGSTELYLIGITQDNDTLTMDKTWKEIYDAADDGKYPIAVQKMIPGRISFFTIGAVYSDSENYYVMLIDGDEFITGSENDYPSYTWEEA